MVCVGEHKIWIIEPTPGFLLGPEHLNGSGNDGISIHAAILSNLHFS